jgi:hypothetical protein
MLQGSLLEERSHLLEHMLRHETRASITKTDLPTPDEHFTREEHSTYRHEADTNQSMRGEKSGGTYGGLLWLPLIFRECHAPAWLLEPGWSPAFPGGYCHRTYAMDI